VQQNMDNYYYRCRLTNNNSCSVASDGGRLSVIPVHTVITEAGVYSGCLNNVVIPISVTNFIDISGFELYIWFNDSTHLTYLGQQNVHPSLGSITVNISSGLIYLSWNGAGNLTFGSDTIVE